MAWAWGDSFDCYAAPADLLNGYWDSGTITNFTFVAGRFAGSQALVEAASGSNIVKSSGQNDAVHHIVCAFRQTAAISGSTLGFYIQLIDSATAQCSVVFRSDGAILLTSGIQTGTVLATYTGAFPVTNTWYAFEIEVVISGTAGWMNVRKNGNTVNDFTSATNLVTRLSANNYANKLQLGGNTLLNAQHMDDLYWRSDASSVPWAGDMKCITRYPASDASVQFSRAPTSNTQTPFALSTTQAISTTVGSSRYTPFTAAYDGTIGAATVSLATGYTGNMKCSIFSVSGNAPTAILGSANILVNPATGSNTITFGTPVAVTKGTLYWIGFASDTASGSWNVSSIGTGWGANNAYATFPTTSPGTIIAYPAIVCSLTIATSSNATVVSEPQQDTTTSYVYDSVPGHADFYGINAIASTPLTTFAVVTRAYAIKSDAGTRTMAVQLKSGATTDASSTVVLTPSGWQWAWKHYTLDPATGAAWTAAAVNVCNIGPTVIA